MSENFWTRSAITAANRHTFGARVAAFDPGPPLPHPWSRPGELVRLPRPGGPLDAVLSARRSVRRFAAARVSTDDLACVLGILAADQDGHRGHAAAGAIYSVTLIAWLYRVDHPLNGRTTQYDPVSHALADIGPVPAWTEESRAVTGTDESDPPPVLLGLFVDVDSLRAKYGERGDRFALLEAGEVLQQISLAVAARKLCGYAIGASIDQRMVWLAGLARTNAKFVLAYAFGRP